MKTQQQAEREEQQRIKNLVLNYDLRESEDHDGDTTMSPFLLNPNIHNNSIAGHEKTTTFHINRPEKQGKDRGAQRVRRLEMNDLDWYDNTRKDNHRPAEASPSVRREASDEIQSEQKSGSKRTGQQFFNKREESHPRSHVRRSSAIRGHRIASKLDRN